MKFLMVLFGQVAKTPYLCTVSNSTKLHKMRERADDRRETGVSFIKEHSFRLNV